MAAHHKITDNAFIDFLIGHVFTASIFSFSVDFGRAMLLGVAGGLGSLLVRFFHNLIKKHYVKDDKESN
jgi:hypothetical protein